MIKKYAKDGKNKKIRKINIRGPFDYNHLFFYPKCGAQYIFEIWLVVYLKYFHQSTYKNYIVSIASVSMLD